MFSLILLGMYLTGNVVAVIVVILGQVLHNRGLVGILQHVELISHVKNSSTLIFFIILFLPRYLGTRRILLYLFLGHEQNEFYKFYFRRNYEITLLGIQISI